MMRPKHILVLLSALLLLFSSCKDGSSDDPTVSASVTEDTTPAGSAIPEAEDTTEYQMQITDLPAHVILEISEKLSGIYSSYTRRSSTETEINILGDITRTESESELTVSGGNALFHRIGNGSEEEYYLIDGCLCYEENGQKYRIGNHNTASFAALFADQLPFSAFDEGIIERDGEDILLLFDKLAAEGESTVRAMLGLGEEYLIDIQKAELTARTDINAHLKTKELALELSVSKNGTVLMKVSVSSKTEQSLIGEQIALDLPDVSEHVYFPDSDTLELYAAAIDDYVSFVTSHDSFEFTEKDEITVSSGGTVIKAFSKADYAYASLIGASIDKVFDLGDGTGNRTLLTHFNNEHGFSQIDGGSIFVDETLNESNLFLTLFHPFETSIRGLGSCSGVESAENGRITLALNDSAVKNIAQTTLLHAGITASDLEIFETERADTYIAVDENGNVTSAGYTLAATVSIDGKACTLSRTVSLEITSRETAKVKVIYIEVEEEEE